MTTLLAQLSDPHIVGDGLLGGVLDTAAYLSAAVDAVNAADEPFDGVLLTGDLVDDGSRGAYERLAQILDRLEAPCWTLVGNHDDAAVAVDVLGDRVPSGGPSPGSGVVTVGDVSVVALNSAVPGCPSGSLSDADLDWVAEALAEANVSSASTVLALHHPPVPVGLAHMDGMRLDPSVADELAEIVNDFVVDVVVVGHLHRMTVTRWAGTVVTSAPGVAHATGAGLSPSSPLSVTLEPPGFLAHRFAPLDYPTSHLFHVGEFPGRVLFDGPPHRFES